MANYTVTTSVPQERALTKRVAKYNADPANASAPVTNLQYLRLRLDHILDAEVASFRAERQQTLEQRYEDATPAAKASVDATLGYTE